MKLLQWFAGWYWACVVIYRFYHTTREHWFTGVPSWFVQEVLEDDADSRDSDIQMIVRQAKQHALTSGQ